MNETPKGNRLQIGIFGRVNTGKSSFLNLVLGQQISITSPVGGTTTDVVEKAMELLPIGPVLFLDTAGLDDKSELASLRIQKTEKVFARSDVIVLVTEPESWTEFEDQVVTQADQHKIPVILVINKSDLKTPSEGFLAQLRTHARHVVVSTCADPGQREEILSRFKSALMAVCPDEHFNPPPLVADLVPSGGLIVMVVPIDLQAPKGRLILPQVQTIREALDIDAAALVVKERELMPMLQRLKEPPSLVVCDSQAVLKVTADVPPEVPCTTFSILFARAKGDLAELARGAAMIGKLKAGDRILMAEGCSHHSLQDDIGKVKIPRWLRQYVGLDLEIDHVNGRDFPKDLSKYQLIIHCGSCTLTRRELLNRIEEARRAGVPITNYGVAISFLQGVAERVLAPFPAARRHLEET